MSLIRATGCRLLAVAMLLSLLGHVPAASDPAAAAIPQPVGRDASPQEALALDKTVNLFLDALRQRRFLAAWELLTNTPEGWDCHTWSEKMFVSDVFPSFEPDDESSVDAAILLFASESRLIQARTFGDTGAALFAVEFQAPINLILTFHDPTWQIDWNASQDVAATNSLIRLSAEIRNIRLDTLLKIIVELAGGGDFSRMYWMALTSEKGIATSSCETTARRIGDDGRAVVELRSHTELYLVVPLKLGPGGWIVDMDAKCRAVLGDHKLSRSDAPVPEATTAPATPPAPPAPAQ